MAYKYNLKFPIDKSTGKKLSFLHPCYFNSRITDFEGIVGDSSFLEFELNTKRKSYGFPFHKSVSTIFDYSKLEENE